MGDRKKNENNYITPAMMYQRLRTIGGLELRPDENVLDAGCGTGLLTQEIAIAVGSNGRVVGVDNSLDMLDIAKNRCKGLPQVQFKKGTVEELPEKDNSFNEAVTWLADLFRLGEKDDSFLREPLSIHCCQALSERWI